MADVTPTWQSVVHLWARHQLRCDEDEVLFDLLRLAKVADAVNAASAAGDLCEKFNAHLEQIL